MNSKAPCDESGSGLVAAERQLGRSLRQPCRVIATCHLGLPVVLEVGAVLEDGTPFPTRYWLSCPLARKRLSRLESRSYLRWFEKRVAEDPRFAEALEQAHRDYEAERIAALPPGYSGRVPKGGVAGVSDFRSVKCLHAHYAHHLAGKANPVGAEVAPMVEPLNCTLPCVDISDAAENPSWKEPTHPVSGPRTGASELPSSAGP